MDDTTAGQALRNWRGERTQAWLAKQLGVVQTTVSRLETGDIVPTRAMILAIEHLTDGAVPARLWGLPDDTGAHPVVAADPGATGTDPSSG